MNKKIRKALLLTGMLTAAVVPQLNAATIDKDFTVSVALTSVCTASAPALTLDFGSYTAFQAGAQVATPIDVAFTCTRGLTISGVAFDITNGTLAGGGVINGLNYDIDVDGGNLTAGTEATSADGFIGSADIMTYAVSGSMLAGQAGTEGATASHIRTLTMTY